MQAVCGGTAVWKQMPAGSPPAQLAHHLRRHVGGCVHHQVKLKLHGAGGACTAKDNEERRVSCARCWVWVAEPQPPPAMLFNCAALSPRQHRAPEGSQMRRRSCTRLSRSSQSPLTTKRRSVASQRQPSLLVGLPGLTGEEGAGRGEPCGVPPLDACWLPAAAPGLAMPLAAATASSPLSARTASEGTI